MTSSRTCAFRRAVVVLFIVCGLGSSATLRAQYDADAVEPIARFKGTFFVGGGGELPAEVMDRFVEMAGGESATVVVLSTDAIPDTLRAEIQKRKAKVIGLAGVSRKQASTDGFSARLTKAAAVWIASSDAAKFADVFRGTSTEAALRDLIRRAGVIGGNGAVTRAMTKVMIRGGSPHATVGVGLDLIPGAVVDDHYTAKKRRARVLGTLAAQPDLVGLGVEAKTAMVIHHRFIDVLGVGSVYGCVSASEKRPLRIDRMNRRESPASQRRARRANPRTGERPAGRRGQRAGRGAGQRTGQRTGQRPRRTGQRGGRRRSQPANRGYRPNRLGDLIALSRSAHARVAERFPAYDPVPPNVEKGTLVIVGGGGMPPGLMAKFIELAGGPEAPLVYIPCSESESITSEPGILRSWRRAGAKNVDWIHTKDRTKSDHDPEILNKLKKAKGIWFGGGRQWNLVDSYQNTNAHRLMHDVLARGGVIGGSSAGASIQGSYMARGNSLGNLDSMAEGYETGLGFLTGCAIDQHFTQRGRLPDMTKLVDTYPALLGIGLDEASSIIVQGTVAEVFSREGRNVLFYDRTKPVIPGQPDYLLLEHGKRYDLKERREMKGDPGGQKKQR